MLTPKQRDERAMRILSVIEWDKHKARTLTVTDDGDRLYEEARHG